MPLEYSWCPLSSHVKNWVILRQGSLLSFQSGRVHMGILNVDLLVSVTLLCSSGLKTLPRTGLPSLSLKGKERDVPIRPFLSLMREINLDCDRWTVSCMVLMGCDQWFRCFGAFLCCPPAGKHLGNPQLFFSRTMCLLSKHTLLFFFFLNIHFFITPIKHVRELAHLSLPYS